jgi:2-haloacid dehalogenase
MSEYVMRTTRRRFLIQTSAAAALAAMSVPSVGRQMRQRKFRAVAFDAFVIFDPRPIFAYTERLFPEDGSALNMLWKDRILEYTWLRTLSGRYADFASVIVDALVFATRTLKINLKTVQKQDLVNAFFLLKPWPDAPGMLRQLQSRGISPGLLSDFGTAMLAANLKSSELEGCFDQVLSTDKVKAFKPDPRAYRMGIDGFKLKHAEIVFAAFGGWDAAGAKAFGYPTFWVNRMSSMEEELGATADATGELSGLIKYLDGNI